STHFTLRVLLLRLRTGRSRCLPTLKALLELLELLLELLLEVLAEILLELFFEVLLEILAEFLFEVLGELLAEVLELRFSRVGIEDVIEIEAGFDQRVQLQVIEAWRLGRLRRGRRHR